MDLGITALGIEHFFNETCLLYLGKTIKVQQTLINLKVLGSNLRPNCECISIYSQ